MYKVFSNASSIIINSEDKNLPKNYESVKIDNKDDMQIFMEKIFSDDLTGDFLLTSKGEFDVFGHFKTYFKILYAAGGIVNRYTNSEREVLYIKRFGYWDFPKGKIEKGEEIEDAALREVKEETMIDDVTISKELPATWHIYFEKNKWILKKTYWFEMITNSNKMPAPQTEEGIESAEWKNFEEAKTLLAKSYRSLKEGFEDYFNY